MKKPVPARKKSLDVEIKQKDNEKLVANKSNETKNSDSKKEETRDGIKEISPIASASQSSDQKVEEELKKKRKLGENLEKILTDDQIVFYD